MRVHQRDPGIVEGHVEELALARAGPLEERHQHPDRGVEPGAEVDQRDADPGAIDHAVDREHADHRLDHGVVTRQAAHRAVGAEAADPAVDQAREARPQHVCVAQAPLLHGARLEVLDQHVRALEQAQQHVAALGLGQIEPEGALVAVDADEVGGVVRFVERRPPIAHLVALGRLDLDHLGAMVAQDLGAVRPTQHARQIEHEQAVERAFGHVPVRPSLNRRIGQIALGQHVVGRVGTIDRKAVLGQAGLVDGILDGIRIGVLHQLG